VSVLIVEDETLIAVFTASALQDAGYSVISVSSADEAIAVLESRNDVRVLVTDIDMPGSMDGLKLAAAVRNRWPPIQMIIVSGKKSPGTEQMPSGAIFIPKPFDPMGVVGAVHRLF
jgi:DNA-binding NtrC family response regulator